MLRPNRHNCSPAESAAPAERPSAIEWLTHPAALLAAIILIQFVGRAVAINGPSRVDSFIYALNAYVFYSPGVTAADLVKDKPGGQALLTGWVYRLWSEPPTRLTLVPIESAFMLGAFAVFAAIVLRTLPKPAEGTGNSARLPIALAVTAFVAIAENVYSALDSTTDGFNLGENYLLLPVLGAVYAHLCMRQPLGRGLLRGLCIGIAITIKQTAVAVLLAIVLDEVISVIRRQARGAAVLRSAIASAGGIILGVLPLMLFLSARGWLGEQLHAVLLESRRHVGGKFSALQLRHFEPMLPLLWIIGLGAVGAVYRRLRRSGRPQSNQPAEPAKQGSVAPAPLQFTLIWLAIEGALLASMVKPSTHYYQPFVLPVALLAACAVRPLWSQPCWRCVALSAAGLAVLASLPLLGGYQARGRRPDMNYERRAFAGWLEHWPAAPDPIWTRPPTEGQP